MKPLLLTILLTLSSILSVSANSDTPLNIHTCVNCEQKFTNQETCIHCFYPIHEYIPEFNTAQMKFLKGNDLSIEITPEEQAIAKRLNFNFQKDTPKELKLLLWRRTVDSKGEYNSQDKLAILLDLEYHTHSLPDPLSQALHKLYKKQLVSIVKESPSSENVFHLYCLYQRINNPKKADAAANFILSQEKEHIGKNRHEDCLIITLRSRQIRSEIKQLTPQELVTHITLPLPEPSPDIFTICGTEFNFFYEDQFYYEQALHRLTDLAIEGNEQASAILWKMLDENENLLIKYINHEQAINLYYSTSQWQQWYDSLAMENNIFEKYEDAFYALLRNTVHHKKNEVNTLNLYKTRQLIKKRKPLHSVSTSASIQFQLLMDESTTYSLTPQNKKFYSILLLSSLTKIKLSKEIEPHLVSALSYIARHRHQILPTLKDVHANKKFQESYIRDSIGVIIGNQKSATQWVQHPLASSNNVNSPYKTAQLHVFHIVKNPILLDRYITSFEQLSDKEIDYLCTFDSPELHQSISKQYYTEIAKDKKVRSPNLIRKFEDYFILRTFNTIPFKATK